jgi:hypothetical protein
MTVVMSQIPDLYPGPVAFTPEPPPAGYFLDSVRLGNSEASQSPLQLVSGGQRLTITYKYGGGSVRGTVEGCGSGEVTLVPRDTALRHPSMMRRAPCTADGKFEMLSVRPGDYYAFALASDDYFAADQPLDTDMVRQSTSVRVVDTEAVAAEVRLIKR